MYVCVMCMVCLNNKQGGNALGTVCVLSAWLGLITNKALCGVCVCVCVCVCACARMCACVCVICMVWFNNNNNKQGRDALGKSELFPLVLWSFSELSVLPACSSLPDQPSSPLHAVSCLMAPQDMSSLSRFLTSHGQLLLPAICSWS